MTLKKRYRMKKEQILLILISIFIFSCSPQARLNRLEKKHPELFKVDTLWRYDTTRIESTQFDTILLAGATKDTITIHDSLMTIRYYSDGKKVYIQGITKTIVKVNRVPYQIKAPVIYKIVHKVPFWVYVYFGALILTLLLFAVKR